MKWSLTKRTLVNAVRILPKNGPTLADFLQTKDSIEMASIEPIKFYNKNEELHGSSIFPNKIAIETFGCQMNVADTELVRSILLSAGFILTNNAENSGDIREADAVLLMTCAIRENAEAKIFDRIDYLRNKKKNRPLMVGILGCMAERLKGALTQGPNSADVVCGPDAYRTLPSLLRVAGATEEPSMNVQLSIEETYAELRPVRLDPSSKLAFVSIMRGCDNMCSYCIVPFTRGRERSRSVSSIVDEVQWLVKKEGVKCITLLGQNVNSYLDVSTQSTRISDDNLAEGFKTIYKPKLPGIHVARFVDLLDVLSSYFPETWFRFTSPHPKDFPHSLLKLMAERKNICKHIHLPVQSGSTDVLERMRRGIYIYMFIVGYSREAYINLLNLIRNTIPNITISTDIIVGFCGETEEEFQETLSLIELAKYDTGYLFAYSQREKTHAARVMKDDVPEDIKKTRLKGLIERFYQIAGGLVKEKWVGTRHRILLEGPSRRNANEWVGRNEGNKNIIIKEGYSGIHFKAGEFVAVEVIGGTASTLFGRLL